MQAQQESKTKITKIQKLIGQRMLQSKRTKPCFYLHAKADISWINKNRRKLSKQLGSRITTNDFYIKAAAAAIEMFPLMTGEFQGDYIQIAQEINIGLAVASPAGLVVPVVKRANEKTIDQIASEIARLTDKAKQGKLTLDDLAGPCITISALGMFGIDSFIAIPSPHQASILSVGKVINTPVCRKDEFQTIKQAEFCLSVDHRVANGDYAAKFLAQIVNNLENPQSLSPA